MNRLRTILGLACLLFALPAWCAEPIERSSHLPETTPWDLAKLSEPPAFEWIDKAAPVRSLFYEGEPFGGQPTQIFAYYATPGTLAGSAAPEKKLPAVVLIHGGGGTAFREWAELWAKRGYAAIAMDLAGCRPIEGKNAHASENRTRLEHGGPGQGDDTKFGAIGQPPTEQWPYHAVASAIRAHSLVRSFPEVDASKTAVTGISWGGYLTCIVAGVDSRFKAAVPVYGCGYLDENSAWLDRFERMTPADRERWVKLWDPSRYLPAVSAPILFVNGTNDFAYPLDSYMKSYDAVPGEKQIRVTVNMPHGHPPGWEPQEIGLFVDHHLLDKPPLPQLGEPKTDEGMVRVTWKSAVKLKEAALHYTTETEPINKRKWETTAAMIDGEAISAPAPPESASAWFLTATDDRGAIVSTRVWLADRSAEAKSK
jgi:dienelactone hydrolase